MQIMRENTFTVNLWGFPNSRMKILSNCEAKQDEIPQQLYPVPACIWNPSLSLPALMSYNLDLKRPQIILRQVQEFNFLWLHLMYLKNTFQEIFKKRLLIQPSFKWYPIQVTWVNWSSATLKLSLKSCLTLFFSRNLVT